MAYTLVRFRSSDAWGRYVYSFKLNMITKELSVEYVNNTGGLTMNGVVLNERQYNHIRQLIRQPVIEKFRDGSWKSCDGWMLDPNSWEATFLSDDGTSMLKLDNNQGQYLCTAPR